MYVPPYKQRRYHVPEFQHIPPRGKEETFTHRNSSPQNVVERAFGVLKIKWLILLGMTWYKLEVQTMIIDACMCLHNYILDNSLRDEHFDMFDAMDIFMLKIFLILVLHP
jgi:hypothetical protein